MNTSSSLITILRESESPVPGDFIAVSADKNTGISLDKKGNGYVGMALPNDRWVRVDFTAPPLAVMIFGSIKPANVPWLILQLELPSDFVPSASLHRVYLLTCALFPVAVCAFSPGISKEKDVALLLDAIPDTLFFIFNERVFINPKFKDHDMSGISQA